MSKEFQRIALFYGTTYERYVLIGMSGNGTRIYVKYTEFVMDYDSIDRIFKET